MKNWDVLQQEKILKEAWKLNRVDRPTTAAWHVSVSRKFIFCRVNIGHLGKSLKTEVKDLIAKDKLTQNVVVTGCKKSTATIFTRVQGLPGALFCTTTDHQSTTLPSTSFSSSQCSDWQGRRTLDRNRYTSLNFKGIQRQFQRWQFLWNKNHDWMIGHNLFFSRLVGGAMTQKWKGNPCSGYLGPRYNLAIMVPLKIMTVPHLGKKALLLTSCWRQIEVLISIGRISMSKVKMSWHQLQSQRQVLLMYCNTFEKLHFTTFNLQTAAVEICRRQINAGCGKNHFSNTITPKVLNCPADFVILCENVTKLFQGHFVAFTSSSSSI